MWVALAVTMSEMRNRTRRKSARAPEWGIRVRLNDGSYSFFSSQLDAAGNHDWSPRVRQALRFETEAEARRRADMMQTNRTAIEYEVVHLPQP